MDALKPSCAYCECVVGGDQLRWIYIYKLGREVCIHPECRFSFIEEQKEKTRCQVCGRPWCRQYERVYACERHRGSVTT